MRSEPVVLKSPDLTASVSPFGAELVGLRHARSGELLWRGDTTWWDRQSPLLFPVCGRSIGNQVRVDGRDYPMPLHGFAHSMIFDLIDASPSHVRFRLTDSAATRKHYPFPFRLDVTYRLDNGLLEIVAEVTNTGDGSLPASFGFHPGFVWPLPGASSRDGHQMVLGADTHLDVLRADGGGFMLPQAETFALPERRLNLHDSLFEAGAMVMRAPASRSVRYQAGGADFGIQVAWAGPTRLLFWTRPSAPFICIEPWAGEPDPSGFSGELTERPGIDLITPGAQRSYMLSVSVEPI